jgi:O-6-methylguanine DNA methyltransferase
MKKNEFTPLEIPIYHRRTRFLTGFTSFQRKVFKIVSKIPLGQTRSYQWVARRIGRPKASRAVGQVLKHNPYPLIIPCHRVIKSNGSLGGYTLGKKIKRALLKLERELASVI